MSELQMQLRNQLLTMGYEAPANYTLTQLKKKVVELEKSFEEPVPVEPEEPEALDEIEQEPSDEPPEPPEPSEPSDEPPEPSEPSDEPPVVTDRVHFIAVYDFTFRGESYKAGEKYFTTLKFYNNFKLQNLVKNV
jgi:hypothetical protein